MPNCKVCDSENCLTCSEGYFVENGMCSQCSFGCSKCIDRQTCETCFEEFYLNTDQDCELCTDNCIQCTSTSCETCSYGYFLNEFNKCSPCSQLCGECTSDENCVLCEEGYLENGLCKAVHKVVVVVIQMMDVFFVMITSF